MPRGKRDEAVNTYVQTYSTASRTHPAQTQVAGDMAATGADALNAAEAIKINAHLDAIRADVIALSKVVVALIDDLQTHGLIK